MGGLIVTEFMTLHGVAQAPGGVDARHRIGHLPERHAPPRLRNRRHPPVRQPRLGGTGPTTPHGGSRVSHRTATSVATPVPEVPQGSLPRRGGSPRRIQRAGWIVRRSCPPGRVVRCRRAFRLLSGEDMWDTVYS